MTTSTMSSREFNQDLGRAKRSADAGPLVITDRGKPAYVLLRHEAYQRLVAGRPGIRAQLDLAGVEDVDFEPPRLQGLSLLPADLG